MQTNAKTAQAHNRTLNDETPPLRLHPQRRVTVCAHPAGRRRTD